MPVRGGQFVDSDDEEDEEEDGERGEDVEESHKPSAEELNLAGQENGEAAEMEESQQAKDGLAGVDEPPLTEQAFNVDSPSTEQASNIDPAPQPQQTMSLDDNAGAHTDPQTAETLPYQDAEEVLAAIDLFPEPENISALMDHDEDAPEMHQTASPNIHASTSPLPGTQKKASPKKASQRPRPVEPPTSPKVPLDTFGVNQNIYLHAFSKHKSVPLLTFAQKLPSSFIPPNSTPAPDTYKTVDGSRTSKYIDRPRYSIPAAERFPREEPLNKKQPGPGAYPVNKFEKFKYLAQPTSSFGSCARGRSNPIREYGPGPGEYEVRGNPAKDGPMFAMQGKFRKRGVLNYNDPGPGAYDPKTVLCQPMWTKVGMGTSLREDYEAKRERNIPGPGAYDVAKNLVGAGSAKFSVASRRKKIDLSSHLNPGPGFYNVGSSFGYVSTCAATKEAPVAARTT